VNEPNPELEGNLAREFVNSPFYRFVFKPFFDEQKTQIHDKVDELLLEDASKYTLAVQTGKRRQLKIFEEWIETLCKRTSKS